MRNTEQGRRMAKLYFKYGAMGAFKTANALITKINCEERGMRVWLIKQALDDRKGVGVVHSRIGLEAQRDAVSAAPNLFDALVARRDFH